MYLWADGVYFRIHLGEDRIACQVTTPHLRCGAGVGVLADGTKEVISLKEGYHESQQPWASLLRDLKRRGMKPPMLALGDADFGFWAALRDAFPECRGQRCWVNTHALAGSAMEIANVLDKLVKRLQPKDVLPEIMYAPDQEGAEEGMQRFQEEYEARYAKAVEWLLKDRDALPTFFDFPAAQWIHLRTTNPIESPVATVKTRTRQTKGAGSRKAGLAMAFKSKILTRAGAFGARSLATCQCAQSRGLGSSRSQVQE